MSKLTKWISRVASSISAQDAEMPEMPVVRKSSALPSYVKSARTSSDTFLPQDDLRLGTLDIETIRATARNTQDLLRKLNKASPDLSAATFTAPRMCVSKYMALARNLDGSLNPEGTKLVQQLCRKFDLTGPAKGFNDYGTLRAVAESLVTELMLLGGMSVELVLDSARLPEGFRAIAVDSVKFKYKQNRRVPYQVIGGEEILLDIPTFFYASIDQDLTTPYAESPVQSSLQPIQASQTFQNDTRRVMKRAIHPRLLAMIKEEAWRKTVPSHILHDPEKLLAFAAATLENIRSTIDGLGPDDALVGFDTVEFDYMNGGNSNVSEEYKVLAALQNGKIAAGAKTSAVVLGHEAAASTNIASTQSMLGVKTYSSLQRKLNEIFSRALTLAVRLYGVDCVVEFEFQEVDLRPEMELEAYKSMKQSRIYEQLSVGQITDEEAALALTGSLPPAGAPKLSGTFFKTGASTTIANPDSQTSVADQTLQPDTPAAPKSSKSQQGGK